MRHPRRHTAYAVGYILPPRRGFRLGVQELREPLGRLGDAGAGEQGEVVVDHVHPPVPHGRQLGHRIPELSGLRFHLRRGRGEELDDDVGVEGQQLLSVDRRVGVLAAGDDVLAAGDPEQVVHEVPPADAGQAAGVAGEVGADGRPARDALPHGVEPVAHGLLRCGRLLTRAGRLADGAQGDEQVVEPVDADVDQAGTDRRRPLAHAGRQLFRRDLHDHYVRAELAQALPVDVAVVADARQPRGARPVHVPVADGDESAPRPDRQDQVRRRRRERRDGRRRAGGGWWSGRGRVAAGEGESTQEGGQRPAINRAPSVLYEAMAGGGGGQRGSWMHGARMVEVQKRGVNVR